MAPRFGTLWHTLAQHCKCEMGIANVKWFGQVERVATQPNQTNFTLNRLPKVFSVTRLCDIARSCAVVLGCKTMRGK